MGGYQDNEQSLETPCNICELSLERCADYCLWRCEYWPTPGPEHCLSGRRHQLPPDGRHVAFKIISATSTDLYVSHVNGAYYTRVTALGSNREVTDVTWSPNSTRLVYLADANVDNQYELFMTAAAFDSSSDISSH